MAEVDRGEQLELQRLAAKVDGGDKLDVQRPDLELLEHGNELGLVHLGGNLVHGECRHDGEGLHINVGEF